MIRFFYSDHSAGRRAWSFFLLLWLMFCFSPGASPAGDKTNTVVFPMPIDLVNIIQSAAQKG